MYMYMTSFSLIQMDYKCLLWQLLKSMESCHKGTFILQYALLTLSALGENFNRHYFAFFLYFSQKTGFEISCILSPREAICMKCRNLFFFFFFFFFFLCVCFFFVCFSQENGF